MAETVEEHQHHINLAFNVVLRDREAYNYQVHIDNYSAILANLPTDDWPVGIAIYKGTRIDELPLEMTDEDVALVSTYQYRDRLKALVRTERAEQAKVNLIKDAMKAQIPPEEYDVLIADAIIQVNAQA